MRLTSVKLVALLVAGGLATVGCGGSNSSPAKHKIGGNVSGLSGTGLVLHSSLGDDLPIASNGPFTFPTTAAKGTDFEITVASQPPAPEICTVAPASGTVADADVSVDVTCSTHTYTVGGTVSGLATAGLVLQNNGGSDLSVNSGATTFVFPAAADGSAYAVTVKTQPSGMVCTVANGSGTLAGANVTNVAVTCTDPVGVIQKWLPSHTDVVYTRDREAWDASNKLYAVNEPRVDATKGYLFGLQGGNRLNGDAGARSSAFNAWTASGVQVATSQVAAPDNQGDTAELLTFTSGGSLSTPLQDTFFRENGNTAPVPVHGMIWLRVAAATTGTLRFTLTDSGGSSHQDFNVSTLAPNTWTRVALKDLTTNLGPSSTNFGNFSITATTGTPAVYAWGADITQITKGSDPGTFGTTFDPGQAMYDTATGDPTDTLKVTTTVPQSTATTGFCLSVDAQPYDGGPIPLSWTTPLVFKRGLVAWFSGSGSATASLYATGTHVGNGQLCFYVQGAFVQGVAKFNVVCGPVPSGWAAGSKHNVKGCVTAGKVMSIYGDDALLPQEQAVTMATDNPLPDLQGGNLVVGNTSTSPNPSSAPDPQVPWDGYISKAIACFERQDRSTTCQ